VGKKLVLLLSLFIALFLSNPIFARHLPYGDLNADYKVDGSDLNLFTQQWLNPSGCSGPSCADFDGENGVNINDFALLANSWLSDNKPITLVINEFMAANSGYILDEYENSDDWIELYNYGDAPVDIADMYMSDSPATPTEWHIPDNNSQKTIIPPHSFLLIWADDEMDEGTLHANFKLSANDGDEIYLYDAGGNLIDSIVFGPQNDNESFGRLPDASENWQTFTISTTPPPTPGKANAGAPSANQIVINEIMYNTSSFNELEEYIEIYNQGSTTVSLGNWKFIDGVSFTFPPDLTIDAGQYLVIAADVTTFNAKYPSVTNVIGSWVGQLSRKGERITLVDEIGVVIDEVQYSDEGDWAQRLLGPLDYGHRGWIWSDDHDGGGKSLELINPAMPNEYGQNWTASSVDQGTPGSPNPSAQSDTAPLIIDAKHYPFIPTSSDTVTVKAQIIDELSTGVTVTLNYRVDGAGTFTQVGMADDGLNGDELAGDSIYTANIPAYPHKTIIELYIEAEDSSNNTRTFPAPSDVDGTPSQITNMLYVVDDTFNPVWTAGNQPIYYIIMTAAERAELEDISAYGGDPFTGEGASNAQMNATFISLDGTDMKIRYNTGVRNRGNHSRVDPPMNYHVNFRNDDLWKNVAAININSKYAFNQVIGSAMFRLADLPAPVTALIEVRVNGDNIALTDEGRMHGSYAALEAYSTYLAENHFPDDPDGNLYRCSYFRNDVDPMTYADLIYRGTNPDDYVLNYIKKTNEEEADYNDIFNLTFVLSPEYINGIPDVNFFEEVNDVINIEKWMRYLAVDTLIGNNEGGLITGEGDDYAVYRGVNDTRFWLMPHDLDTILDQGDYTYGTSRSIFSYENIDGLYRLFNDPQIVQIYYNQLVDLINTIFAADNFNNTLDNILANSYVPQANIDAMKQFAANRVVSVLSQIPQDFSAGTALPLLGGYYRTDANVAVVSGTANALQTKSVLVNGLKAAWDPITGQWSFGEGGGDIISQVALVEEDSAKTVHIPTEAVPDDWRSDPDFDDSTWNDYTFVPGKTGSVGYENSSGYQNYISYDVSDMDGENATCLIRIPFVVTAEQLESFNFLILQMRYDDGFVAFINGQQVEARNEPDPLNWDSGTLNGSNHEAGLYFDDFPINNHLGALHEGENILAIHGLNASAGGSSDFLISAKLIAGTMGQTYEGVALNPGINRVIIQTFDEPNGAGNLLHQDYVDIWYDTGGGTGEITYEVTLVTEDAPKAVHIPSGPVSDTWRSDPNFDDSLWNDYTFVSGRTGSVGYEYDSGYESYISYNVGPLMRNIRKSCLIRIPFTVTAEDLSVLNFMILHMRYDDGFVAYINGQEIASEYEPDPLTWDSGATTPNHEASSTFDEYPASNFISALNVGENILAIHGLNTTLGSSDFLISTVLTAGTISVDPNGEAVIYYYVTLNQDTVWTADEGPYQVIGNLTVPAGIKLTIEPGTSVFFDPDSSIVVGGTIDANGTEYQRIRMTSVPGVPLVPDIRPELPYGPPKWGGIQLQNTMSALNRIAYTDIEYAQDETGGNGSIGLANSQAIIDNVSFAGTHLRMISSDDSSAVISNCTFADMFAEDEWPHQMTPPLDNDSEHIEATGGIPPSGHYIIENNIFGKNKGHNDVIDFTGHSNQLPVVQVLNNVFTGGGDEALDLGGDAYIEGNLFMNFHKDISNTSAGNSNAMSTGDDLPGEGDSVITAVRNVFYDLDYVITSKNNTFLNFENNTVVDIPNDVSGIEYSAINFYCVEKPEPQGKGAYLNSNIFWDIPQRIFGNVDVSDPYNPSFMTDLEMHHTLVPPERAYDVIGERPGTIMDLGINNIAADPLFTDPNDDLSLLSMSPAKRTGYNGIDMGADVPAGASISGGPVGGITYQTSVTLTVAGPAITDYMYKVNEGAWSAERSVTLPILLTGLSNGQSYTVYVLGKNAAGEWQTEPVASETFTIDTSYYRLVINEILAHSHGTAPDIVEIYYDGPAPLDITGYSITDNPDYPQKFVFPPTTIINPGQYKIYYADTNEALPDNFGFALDSYGEGLYLYDQYGGLIDSVEFGTQLNDITIGRLNDDKWHLTIPTLGSENIPYPMASPYKLKINEWIANTDVRFEDDIVEIYNPSPLPVDLGGLYITDDPFARPDRHKIKQLTFVPASGFSFFYADGDDLSRSNHLNFRLSADDGLIALFDVDLNKIDEVIYYSQTADYSQGRYPDGAADFNFFELPTPERSNVQDPDFVNNNIAILNHLRITELMYNTPDVNDVDEYIELHNTGATTLDISGVKFVDGVTYIFPNDTFLPALSYIVLTANPIDFKTQYPLVPDNLIYGPYDGAFDNGGEQVVLTLADPMLAAVLRFEYDDAWYPDTDGLGMSLSIIDPTVNPKDWDKAETWQAAVPTPAAPNPTQSEWDILTYDDFETGWGSFISGGEDAMLYTSGTYAHQGNCAANIQDDSGDASAFWHTDSIDVDSPGYTELKIDFWFYALDMETGEFFKVDFYDGSAYQTVATYISGTDFANNNFYHETIYLEEGTGPGQYNFPPNMTLKFECVASLNTDDIYIDQIEVSAK